MTSASNIKTKLSIYFRGSLGYRSGNKYKAHFVNNCITLIPNSLLFLLYFLKPCFSHHWHLYIFHSSFVPSFRFLFYFIILIAFLNLSSTSVSLIRKIYAIHWVYHRSTGDPLRVTIKASSCTPKHVCIETLKSALKHLIYIRALQYDYGLPVLKHVPRQNKTQ